MAYSTVYQMGAASKGGHDIKVLIKSSAGGNASIRPFGSSPRLKREGEVILGSSLELDIECQVDDEMADLYTSDPTRYMVELYVDGKVFWTGFITPELYACSWTDPPYDVHVTATDGLGELKTHDYEKKGHITVTALLSYLLGKTGQSLSVEWRSTLALSNGTPAYFPGALRVNFDHMADKSCYDVLKALLTAFHAEIYMEDGKWVIQRETDMSSVIAGYDVLDWGSALSSDVWPVGSPRMEIEPAKKSLEFRQDPDYIEAEVTASSVNGKSHNYGDFYSIASGYANRVYFTIRFKNSTYQPNLRLAIPARCASFLESGKLFVQIYNSNGDFLSENGVWVRVAGWLEHEVSAATAGTDADYKDITIELPRFSSASYSTITVDLRGDGATVYVRRLMVEESGGYKDMTTTISLDNDARGKDESRDIEIVDAPLDYEWVGNSIRTSTSGDLAYKTGAITVAERLRTLMAKDYAFSVAMPRLRLQGILDVTNTSNVFPMLLSNRGINYRMEECTWDILGDELDFKSLSLPAAALDIQSITTKTTGTPLVGTMISPNALTFSPLAQSKKVTCLNAAVLPSVPSWLTLSLSSAKNDNLTVRVQANEGDLRTATVLIGDANLYIQQNAAGDLDLPTLTPSSAIVTRDAQTLTFEITNNGWQDISATTVSSQGGSIALWMSTSIVSQDADKTVVSVSVQGNDTGTIREGYVFVHDKDMTSDLAKFRVTQDM